MVRTYEDNTFDLRAPGGVQLLKVAGIRKGLWKTIRPRMTVTLCWMAGGVDGAKVPYVKGPSSSASSPGCIVEGLHLNSGVDVSRTGQELEAGFPPVGMRMDQFWLTEPIGDAKFEYPIALVTGKAGGRKLGWVASAWGANGSNFSPGIQKRITCFDLHNGQTLWIRDVTSLTNPGSNFPVIYLEPAYGEILVANQISSGAGNVYLERLSACTGKTIGTKGSGILVDLPSAQGLSLLADGDYLVGTVPTRVTDAEKCRRLQVFQRSEENAYSPAYQIPIVDGGTAASTSAAGGATPGFYWPEGDQALLLVHQRQGGGLPVVRTRVMAWGVRSGRVEWTWDPLSAAGVAQEAFCVIRGAVRAPDGSIFLLVDMDPPGAVSLSWVFKLSSSGSVQWSTQVNAAGASGKFFVNFGLGIWNRGLLAHFDYNTGSVDQRPIWIGEGGSILEGPANWRLYSIEPCWAQNSSWLYCMFEPVSGGSQLRYHLVGPGFSSLVSWQQANGLSRDQRSTPDAGPVALSEGYVYGVNWDASAQRWRVRRWN